jgi:hypothetical protein
MRASSRSPPTKTSSAQAMACAPSLALGLLRQQLNQRGKRRRQQGHAPLQSVEQAGRAALGDDLAGALQIGPDRLAGKARLAEDRQRLNGRFDSSLRRAWVS